SVEMDLVPIGQQAPGKIRDVGLAPATRRQHALVAKCDVHGYPRRRCLGSPLTWPRTLSCERLLGRRLGVVFAIETAAHQDHAAQPAAPSCVPARSEIRVPEAHPIPRVDALNLGRIKKLAKILGNPERPREWMMRETMKVDHEDAILPRC